MNKGHLAIILLALAVDAALIIGGLLVAAGPDVVTEYCTESHSASWGFLPMMLGFIILPVIAVVAWDELS